jgi:hypothetical protein
MVRGPGFEPGNPAFETGTVASYVSRANWRSRQKLKLDPEIRISLMLSIALRDRRPMQESNLPEVA